MEKRRDVNRQTHQAHKKGGPKGEWAARLADAGGGGHGHSASHFGKTIFVG